MKLQVLALAATSVVALGASQVLAQYPPPAGNIVTTVSNPNPGIGAESGFTVTVQSEAGVAAANVNCTASIASQPGTDASVIPTSFTTDAAGKAALTLHAGSAAGPVTVALKCGELSATTVVNVGTSVPLLPPNTGAGASTESDSRVQFPWLLAGVMIAVTGAAGVAAYRKARSR